METLNRENLELKQQVASLQQRLSGTQDTMREILTTSVQPTGNTEPGIDESASGVRTQALVVDPRNEQQIEALLPQEQQRSNIPETYQVKSGDSLYAISMNFYGDAEHIQAIFQANRNVLRSRERFASGASAQTTEVRMIYFDHNATTPLCDAAREAWLQTQESAWANPSAGYTAAERAKAVLRQARDELARLLGVATDELVFTSGATEACNLWLESFLRNRNSNEKLLVSELDHSCVVQTCKRLNVDGVCWFSPSSSVSIREVLDREVSKGTCVGAVVMMAANNVTGEIFNWQAVAEWCRERGIPFFCDTTQWLGKYGPDRLDQLDFFCGSAHKFGGPKGVGFLKFSRKYRSLCGQTGWWSGRRRALWD